MCVYEWERGKAPLPPPVRAQGSAPLGRLLEEMAVGMTTWGPHIFPSGLPVRLRGTARQRVPKQQGKAPNRAMLLCLCCIPRRLPGTHPAPRGIFSRSRFPTTTTPPPPTCACHLMISSVMCDSTPRGKT